jgi:hypothetical protein
MEVRFDIYQSILGVVGRSTNGLKEIGVEFGRRRGHNVEIGEKPTRVELSGNLGKQTSLSFIFEVVDGKSGENEVEPAEGFDGFGHIPLAHHDPLICLETLLGPLQHRRG